jgi:uncharacterized protein YjbI with pentapeptide repeats
MTVRNWLELLIVPLVLVGIGLLFEMQQANRQLATEQQQQALAEQRAQDEALQAYLSQMSSLLLEKDLRVADKDSEVSTLARARTVTVLQRLDADRNQNVIRFLSEARLTGSAIGLLVESDLQGAHLEGTDLSGVDLSGADLTDADLSGTNLSDSILSGAELNNADLSDAYMSGANLSGAFLRYADLSGALFNNANLSDAELSGANLRGALLRYANLREAQLIFAESVYEAADHGSAGPAAT